MLHIMVVDDEAPIRDWLVYCIQKCEAEIGRAHV